VNEYEILLMLDPEVAEERQTEIVTRTRELVEKGEGTWLSHDVWGRRRLAYEIDHKSDGSYHLLQFDAQPATLDEITRVLKITDGVMRHMATRRVKGGTRAAPPPLPPAEDRPRYEREERRPTAPAAETAEADAAETAETDAAEAGPAQAESAEAETPAEGYAAPTESEQASEEEGA
jgi:small subunit ribosomal protein S6